MTSKTNETAPKRIWLQVDPNAITSENEGFPADHGGITWCDEEIGGVEVEYVRADLVRAVMPVNWEDDHETRALGEALHMTANA